MNIADSADYNGVICYNLLKPHISFAIQQIIWESVDYEHNWERKREGYFNCFFTGYLEYLEKNAKIEKSYNEISKLFEVFFQTKSTEKHFPDVSNKLSIIK